MEKIKKILAPTDLSELSQAGVRYALNLARAVGAEVTVYHVVNYDELLQYGEEMKGRMAMRYPPPSDILDRHQTALTRFLSSHFSDLISWVKVHEKVEIGRPDKNIVEEAKKEGADLIIISTHGRSGLSHMLLGSVTEKVVRTAPCPVLSIHPRAEQKPMEKTAAVA